MEKLYEENWYQKMQNWHFWAKTTRWYRYQNRVLPVPLCLVPVPRQAVPVQSNRMCLVPVPNTVVSVPLLPKCSDLGNFAQLSLSSHTNSMGTLLND